MFSSGLSLLTEQKKNIILHKIHLSDIFRQTFLFFHIIRELVFAAQFLIYD